MARTGGVTREDVSKVASEIESRLGPGGVTLRRVREELGRGSFQTIHAHLKSLRATREIAPADPLIERSGEIVLSAKERGISVAMWISEAIEEKLRRERDALLNQQLVPSSETGAVTSRHDDRAQLRHLAARAVRDFASSCFWNVRLSFDPLEDLPVIFERLRRYGGVRGWKLAASIKDLAGSEAIKWH